MNPDKTIDLRGVSCPVNFVKTKLALEYLEEGQVLEVILDPGEPIINVPRSIREEGHLVLNIINNGDLCKLFIKKT